MRTCTREIALAHTHTHERRTDEWMDGKFTTEPKAWDQKTELRTRSKSDLCAFSLTRLGRIDRAHVLDWFNYAFSPRTLALV